jgi:hypothetical protein
VTGAEQVREMRQSLGRELAARRGLLEGGEAAVLCRVQVAQVRKLPLGVTASAGGG